MRTKFWRFAYEENELTSILRSDELAFPDLSKWPTAKNNSPEKIFEDIKIGDFILLANFNRTSETGIAKAIGKVIVKGDVRINMHWIKSVPSLSLIPNIQGGVAVWNTEGVFCFDDQPAKRYKLDAHAKKLFASGT
jgi:hypothetical protein